MPSKANIQIVGHVGQDMSMSYSQSGTAIVSFSVATNKWQPNADPITTWWNVVMFGQRAESLHANVTILKGDPVVVFGEPFMEIWTDRDGKERKSMKIVASEVMSMSVRRDDTQTDQDGHGSEGLPAAFDGGMPY